MIGEVSALRQEQAAVEAELAEKQEELEAATAALEEEKEHLEEVREQLQRALGVLRERLVAIYEAGSPGRHQRDPRIGELVARWRPQTEYLNQIQSYDDSVVDRVKALRDEVTGAVAKLADNRAKVKQARDSIAAIEREVAAARAEAEARFAELKAAQAERREATGSAGKPRRSAEQQPRLDLRTRSPPKAARSPAEVAGAADPGPDRRFISESEASAPGRGAEAVKAAISAANAIATTPYIWGGGHGSFESSGYDCSGAVSYALHGGGFLESPLDSTGLETWGEPGPGKWITVYANAGHAWMMIAGLAFDTVGGPGPRWHSSPVDSHRRLHRQAPAGLLDRLARALGVALARRMGLERELERAARGRAVRAAGRVPRAGAAGAIRRSTSEAAADPEAWWMRAGDGAARLGRRAEPRRSTTPTRPSTSGSRTGG